MHSVLELAAVGIAMQTAMVFSGWLLWATCLLGWTLLALAAIDFKYYVLPDFLTLPLIPAGLFVGWVLDRLAALFGLVFCSLKGVRDDTVSWTDRVPFGAFLSLGVWLVWLYEPVLTG